MLLPIKWAKEYVDINDDIMNICDKVTLTGSHVESIIKLGDNIDNIVVGKIIDIYRHENSNKLWITKVDLGNEIVQIVTAAQNLKQFDYVPVAKVNSTLSDNTKIKEAKLAGEISQGMFCSYKELGYPDSVIPKEYKDKDKIEKPLGETKMKNKILEKSNLERELNQIIDAIDRL